MFNITRNECFKKITQYRAIARKYYNSGNVLEIIETETIHFIVIYSVYYYYKQKDSFIQIFFCFFPVMTLSLPSPLIPPPLAYDIYLEGCRCPLWFIFKGLLRNRHLTIYLDTKNCKSVLFKKLNIKMINLKQRM